MRNFFQTVILCLIGIVPFANTNANQALDVLVSEDVYRDLNTFLAGRSIDEIDSLEGEAMRRDVAEVIILNRAAREGGIEQPINYINGANTTHLRGKILLANGTFVAHAQPQWEVVEAQFKGRVELSSPILRNGEFLVGIYVAKDNPIAIGRPTKDEVLKLRLSSPPSWSRNTQVIKDVGWPYSESLDWEPMLNMLKRGLIDAVLAPFQPGPAMEFKTEVVDMLPIQGFTVSFTGSRHFAISLTHPRGVEFHSAVERGLAAMRARNAVKQAYTEAGFFRPETSDWLDLNAKNR